MFWRPLAKEKRSGGLGKGSVAGLAVITLNASPGPAKLANIVLRLTFLKLPVVPTSFIWTKISALGKLLHLSPSGSFAQVYLILY
jgi:hypothetical protein